MKKLALLIAFLCLAQLGLKAVEVTPDRQWCVPAQYAMDEEITWYFDFSSAAALPNEADLYMWIWVPNNPAGNDLSLYPDVKLHKEGDRIWALTFTPTTFFSLSAADIIANTESSFYFLLRSLIFDDYHTGTLSFPKVDHVGNFVNSGKVWDYATDDVQNKFYPTSNLSIWFNSNLADGFDGTSGVHIHSGYNNFADHIIEYHAWETSGCEPQSACYTGFQNLGNGIYKKDLVPYQYFGADESDPMENIEFLFVQDDWSATTANVTILAAGVPVPPTPVFSIFPTNVSPWDLLSLKRTDNPRNSIPLTYEITGDNGTVISGEFVGNLKEQIIYIDVRKKFGNNVNSLHIVVKDAAGNEISNSTKQLTTADSY
ncbi:hypothetical protein FACS1894156_1410 [Bacteroidia bacterium]|nr:hypothetical protein FACS1894156_1410 [Bacteroidia bacterium]